MTERSRLVPTAQEVAAEEAETRLVGEVAGNGVALGDLEDGDLVLMFGDGRQGVVEVYGGKRYKKVADRTVPVSATLPEDFRIVRKRPERILADLEPLPHHPPSYQPGNRYTQERHDEYPLDPDGFLWPEELRLAEWIVRENEEGLAWAEEERGSFKAEYFEPIRFPTVPHIPWVLKNIPIPHGIFQKVCEIIRGKIANGVYEPSNSSYRSRWFCVTKKDGTSLRLVHDLRPLNEVTIRDVAALPFIEDIVERAAGKACYTGLDLMVAFDQRLLDEGSRDLTTFQTPFGAHRLTVMPMGYTNSVAILQGDVSFIYQDEIPRIINPFADDCNMNGPETRYETEEGGYEVCPWNPAIRWFIWIHFVNVHRVLHLMKAYGGTFSGKKLYFCVPSLDILGHTVHYGGKSPDKSKVAKIADWPACKTLTEVRAFLGTCGLVRAYVRGFSMKAKALVELTKKDVEFIWGPEQEEAMRVIKAEVIAAPILCAIDYSSDREVILAVDSSYIAVGFILYQLGADGKRRPARFGSITWNERESRYSQAKIELFGLYRALRAWRIYLVGVQNLVVEVDAKYIKDMLNNPDLVPSASINRWIAGIMLFPITLRHVPATAHHAADGLSRRPRADNEAAEDAEEPEEFIDTSYGFLMHRWNPVEGRRPVKNGRAGEVEGALSYEVLSVDVGEDLPEIPTQSERVARVEAKVARARAILEDPEKLATAKADWPKNFVRFLLKFFVKEGKLWRREGAGRHQQYVEVADRVKLLKQAHDELGHKGRYVVKGHLAPRFWWPGMDNDIIWYLGSCHECQVRQMKKIFAPPMPIEPAVLFFRFHIDTMMMPTSNGKRYLVQARESLSAYPEATGLRHENAEALAKFIFFEIICRWGPVAELVTDNGPAYIKAAGIIAQRYGTKNIRISGYNSRANGVVERRHRDLREVLTKLLGTPCKGWDTELHVALWAERVTTLKSVGLSPYQIVTGQEPILPFDLTEATWLVDGLDCMSTIDLLAVRTRQLQRREADLADIRRKLAAARIQSIKQFERIYAHQIHDYDCQPGDIVLVRNKRVEMELDRKTKPRYYGPMVVVGRGRNGTYKLAELDGSLSTNSYAASRILPYHSRSHVSGKFTYDSGETIHVRDVPELLRRVRNLPSERAEEETEVTGSSDGDVTDEDVEEQRQAAEPYNFGELEEDSGGEDSDEEAEEEHGVRRSKRLLQQDKRVF